MQIVNTIIRDNLAPTRNGGSLRTDDRTTTTVLSSLIIRNEAKNGAGIWVDRDIIIEKTTIAANIAEQDGGGLYFNTSVVNPYSEVSIVDSTISENIANGRTSTTGERGGGGFFNNSARVFVENTTISNNYTAGSGGGFLHKPGSAAERANARTVLNNVTIRANRAEQVGGGFYSNSNSNRPLLISNTIISGNDGELGGQECWDEVGKALTSSGYNIVENITDCTNFQSDATTQIGTGANLAPLATNGGVTCTHAIQSPSQAIDRGDPAGTCTTKDQRGGDRPADGDANGTLVCDVGAVEYNASNVPAVPPGTECLFGNEVPLAVDDTYSTPFNTPLVISTFATGVLGNDTDADNDTLIAIVQEAPSKGNLTAFDEATGTFTYVPAIGATGEDSFAYVAFDGIRESAFATVTITIVEPIPVAVVDTYAVTPGVKLTVSAANGVLKNDTDPDGDTLTAQLEETTNDGTLVLNANGGFDYTPRNGFSGTDSFTYRAVDPSNNRSPATTVTLIVSDTRPTAIDDNYVTSAGVDLTINEASGVLANDTDPNDDTLTASIVANVNNGALTFNADGSFTYSPTGSFSGIDRFTYTATDGTNVSNTATVTIEVKSNAPVAFNDSYTVQQNTALNIAAPGILQNDVNPSNGTITITVVGNPGEGTVTVQNTGAFVYTPDNNFVGTDQFTYRFNDGTLNSNTATVTISVTTEEVLPPVANNDSYDVIQNTPLTVSSAQGVLANDTDPNNANLTASIVTRPINGTLTLNANGGFTYTPNQNLVNITDQFTYKASNGTMESQPATVTLSIKPDDGGGGGETAPVAVNDTYTGATGSPLTVNAATGVLSNDTDPNNLTLTASKVTDPINGTLVFNTDGSFTYTPNSDTFAGNDSFTYKANNGTEDSNVATVTITYGAATVPVANPDTYTTPPDTPLIVTAAQGVLANDIRPANSPALTAAKVTDPTNGTLVFNANGSFTYTPSSGYTGTDSFTYTATDGTTVTAPATVTITVQATTGGGIVITAPSGTISTMPVYTWSSVQGTTSYDLWVLSATGATVFYGTIPAADYCTGSICSVNPAQEFNSGWIANGTYYIYVWATSNPSVYGGPAQFQLQAAPTSAPTITPLTGTDYSRPLIEWDAGSDNALWFNIVVVYKDAPSVIAANDWISKYDACDANLDCAARLNTDLLYNNVTYSIYIGSWGPAGYSTGGSTGLGYNGPQDITLNVVAPVTISGMRATTNAQTGKRVFSWTHIPGVSWYQFWVGTISPFWTYGTNWYLAFDQGCLEDGICSIEIDAQYLPAGTTFSWYMQGWGPAGFTPGAVLNTWTQGPDYTP